MARTRRKVAGERRTEAPERGAAFPRIPLWLPPVLYGALTLFLFRRFVFSDDMLFGSDTLSLGYMARAFYADALRSGIFPRWNPLILGGTPFLESLAGGDALYPTSLLLLVMEPYRALGWKLVVHVFLAGLFMFGWVRSLGRSRAAALLAGLAYGLSPLMVSFVHPGHDGKLFVTALTPLLFWAAERTFVGRGLLPYVGVALVVALVLFTTHFQMAYFLFGAAGVYYLFRTVQLWRGGKGEADGDGDHADPYGRRGPRAALPRLGLFLAASVTGAAAAGIQLVPAVDYVLEHSRRTATTTRAGAEDNVAYSSSWGLHPEEAMSFVIPEFAGNMAGGAAWATETYWGRNGWKDNHEYFGLVVLLLAGLSFAGAPRRGLRWFFTGLGAVALLYALGRHTPVWRVFYEVLPGVSLFRSPSTASFLFAFSGITLAAFGVDRALELTGRAGEERARAATGYLWIAAAALALLMLLVASGALLSFWTSVVHPAIDPFASRSLERARPFVVRGAFVATLLALATAGAVWAGRRGWLAGSGVVAVLALLLAFDALRVGRAFVDTLDFDRWAAPDPNVEFLRARQAEEPPFRVASLVERAQDVRPAMFGLELATGHHPNDLARYRELIGMRGSEAPEHLFHPNVYRVLNVRYLIYPTAQMGEVEGLEPVSRTHVGGRPYESVYALPGLPRARLVGEARVVPDEEAVSTLMDPAFDPERVAILAEPPPVTLEGGPVAGEVAWEERGTNRQRLLVTADRAALLVLADNWFPSWRARVDGEDAPVLRAYHALRAVPVPAGTHTVELYYASGVLRGSLALTVATLALLFAVGGVSWARGRRGDAADARA